MSPQALIAKRREGALHSQEELNFLARGAAEGAIPDYQLAAWLMAAVLKPLSPQETAWLTLAMAETGVRLDLSGLPQPCLDKHSTGGVGDKTSIVLLPLLAACGVTVVKMSGRGLGITGGTVDKLESVPGFRMDLTPAELISQARQIGCAITGPTADLAPADRVLYALRDATETVASIPLIVSSILSKKVAGGSKTVVLDVKCGAGAFMRTYDEAEALANALLETAPLCGLELRVAITDMNQPLGRCVGNAIEVREALEVLQGDLIGRFPGLCVHLAGLALHAVQRARSVEDGAAMAREAIKRGLALEKAADWFAAQGSAAQIARSGAGLASSPVTRTVDHAGDPGWISRMDARTVGQAAMALGAGRMAKADAIDPSVGVEVLRSVGESIQVGQTLFRIHAKSEADADQAQASLMGAYSVSNSRIPVPPVVLKTW